MLRPYISNHGLPNSPFIQMIDLSVFEGFLILFDCFTHANFFWHVHASLYEGMSFRRSPLYLTYGLSEQSNC